jgi:sec-independent protein translocase protein TatA
MKTAMPCASQEEKMFRPEPLDVVIIVLVAILLFGANRLPEVARALGQAIREFRNAFKEDKNQQ